MTERALQLIQEALGSVQLPRSLAGKKRRIDAILGILDGMSEQKLEAALDDIQSRLEKEKRIEELEKEVARLSKGSL